MLYTIERPIHTAAQPDTLREDLAPISASPGRWSAELQSPCQCVHDDPRAVSRQHLTCTPLVLRHARSPRTWQSYRTTPRG